MTEPQIALQREPWFEIFIDGYGVNSSRSRIFDNFSKLKSPLFAGEKVDRTETWRDSRDVQYSANVGWLCANTGTTKYKKSEHRIQPVEEFSQLLCKLIAQHNN